MSAEPTSPAEPSRSIAATLVADDRRVERRVAKLLEDHAVRIVDRSNLVVLLFAEGASARLRRIEERLRLRPAQVIVASMPADAGRSVLRRALATGVQGIVLDEHLQSTLAPTIAAVDAGQFVVPPSLRRQLAPQALSYRERQLLSLVVDGYTNRQIADRLYLAESTVKSHLYSAFSKLDASSRAEATALILDPETGGGLGVLELSGGAREINPTAGG